MSLCCVSILYFLLDWECFEHCRKIWLESSFTPQWSHLSSWTRFQMCNFVLVIMWYVLRRPIVTICCVFRSSLWNHGLNDGICIRLKCFVPFCVDVVVYSCIHSWSVSALARFSVSFNGILVWILCSLVHPSLESMSAFSLPVIPLCPGTHWSTIVLFVLLSLLIISYIMKLFFCIYIFNTC